MFKRLKQRGFTLVELMIVVTIVGILAAVCVPLYMSYIQRARIKALVYPGLHAIESNISLYYASMGKMPTNADLPEMMLEANTSHFHVGLAGDDLVITIDSPEETSKMHKMHGMVMFLTPDTLHYKIQTWLVRGSLANYLGINTQ